MQGHAVTKVARLAGDLAVHPGNIPRYIANNLPGKTPLGLRLPWFSYGAIDFLDSWLKPEMTAYEYGTGGSTVFLASRIRHVVAVENVAEWARVTEAALRAQKLFNFEIRHAEIPSGAYFSALPTEPADVVIVDGEDTGHEADGLRYKCFMIAEKLVKPGGIIVLDDSWRYDGIRKAAKAKDRKSFKSVGPARFGVTSTDIFFY